MFGLSWNRYTFSLSVIALILAYLSAYEALHRIAPIVAYLAGGFIVALIGVGGLMILLGGFILGVNTIKTRVVELQSQQIILEANAIAAEAEARQRQILVIQAPKDQQVFIRDEDRHSVYRPAHLSPTYVNGHAIEAMPQQVALYQQFHADSRRALPSGDDQSLIIEALGPQENEKELLPAIARMNNILVVGGAGAGKTALLRWIESIRINEGQQVSIMDSHAAPSQWSGRVIGFNRDYKDIFQEMLRELRELGRRYTMRSRGDESYQARTCIIDEFTLLPRSLREQFDFDIQNYTIPLLTEGRKIKMNCVWGIHSDRVGPMGLEGAGDIRECFNAVVYLKNVKGQRFATVDFGEGKEDIRYRLPGPFYAAPAAAQETSAPPPRSHRPKPGSFEETVCKAWYQILNDENPSANKIYQAINGEGKRGNSRQFEEYRAILCKYGIKPVYF